MSPLKFQIWGSQGGGYNHSQGRWVQSLQISNWLDKPLFRKQT